MTIVIAPERTIGSFNLHLWLENQSKSLLNLGKIFSEGRTERGKEKREEQGPGSSYLVYQNHTQGVAFPMRSFLYLKIFHE